jgi:hypothetical protein
MRLGKEVRMGKTKLTTDIVKQRIYNLVEDEYTVVGEYINSSTPFMIRHNKCGREYPVRLNNFENGKRCASCSGVLKHTIEEAFEAFQKLDLTLVATEYKNAHTPMPYICNKHPEDGIQYGSLTSIFAGQISCKKCRYEKTANSQKRSFKEVQQIFNNANLELVDTEYVNSNTPLKYICPNHKELGVQQTTVSSILGNNISGCPTCAHERVGNNKRMPDDDIIKLFDNYGFDVVEIIKEKNTKVKCICRKHADKGVQIKTLSGIKSGKGCKYCAGIVKLTRDEVENRIKEKNQNLELVSEYLGGECPITLKCNICGYTWETRAENITGKKGSGNCPNCSGSLGERKIYEFLSSKKIKHKREYSFDDLFGYFDHLLRFDFALLDENNTAYCLIEFDGQHHFQPVDYCGEGMEVAMRRHKNTLKYDKKKNDYCETHGLQLIRIPYWEIDNIENILLKELYLNT